MSTTRRIMIVTVLGLAGAGAGPVTAQAWDAPSFHSPVAGDELGLYLIRPPFGDVSVAGIWRQTGDPGLGVRAAYLDLEGGEQAFAIGAEFSGPLVRARRGTRFDATWTAGVGATFGDGTLFRVPAGATLGVRLGDWAEPVLVPFVHPRAALEVLAADDDTVTELALTLDVGADVPLGPSLVLRLAAFFAEGGDNAYGAGLAWRYGRGVAVR